LSKPLRPAQALGSALVSDMGWGHQPDRRAVSQADMRPHWKAGAAIKPRVFLPCVRVVRISSDTLSQRRMSPRISSYTRGQRKCMSETAFPAAAAGATSRLVLPPL